MLNNQSFSYSFKRGFYRMPVAIRSIIAITVVVFLLQTIGGLLGGTAFTNFIDIWFSFIPTLHFTVFQPWRLITYMFLHGGFLHILFNMLLLWWMGRMVEEQLGPLNFCAIYFASGIGGALFDILAAHFLGIHPVIGASGAVVGIMVALAVMYPRMPVLLFLIIPIELRYVIAGFIALQIIWLGGGSDVARAVHLGGAGIGYLMIKLQQGGYEINAPLQVLQRWWYRFKSSSNSKPAARNSNMYSVSDVEIIEDTEQSELDDILEKISKEGYDALTKREKKRLFELSDRD